MPERFEFSKRLRRYRRTESIRALVRETSIQLEDLVQPVFVVEQAEQPEAISSMPGQYRYSIDALILHVMQLYRLGIKAIALFPKLEESLKSDDGAEALNEDTLVLRAIRSIKQSLPEIVIFSDIALDPYTTHGHDGVLNCAKNDVANDASLEILAKMAVLHAKAGADFVAPSDMMDGRIEVIRKNLDANGYEYTGIMAYSAKFASCFYGPFRDAVGSAKSAGTNFLTKKSYQLDPANRKQALLETQLDEEEGADYLMVKPAGAYLDIIRDVSDSSLLPIAAYQVSGEYSQIHAAAKLAWLDYKLTRDESLLAIKRAGATLIFTYFAEEIAKEKAGVSNRVEDLEEYSSSEGI